MKADYDSAVLHRADMATLKVWAQTALRIVLMIVFMWAVTTTVLVWCWLGYYGGPPAHEYFGRWVLAWFFTEIVPLPFGSLPYRGARYPIDRMYVFLCRKYYLGGSFAGWFWHYAPWGAVVTGWLICLVLLLIFRPRGESRSSKYIRGTDVVPTQHLARELAADGITIGDMPTPRRQESQHFIISGAPGTGKSTAIRSMLRQTERRGETAVVLDPECEYVPEFYQPQRGDVILNPLDARSPSWSPWWELRPGSEAMDAEALAAALVPDPPSTFSQGGADFFFRQSARTLIIGLLYALKSRDPADIPKLLGLPRHELKEALRGTPAEVLIDPGAHEQGAGIVATAFNATSAFRHIPHRAEKSWSALGWAGNQRSWLFLSSNEESREAALPLQGVWLDCVIRRLMAREEGSGQVWIFADELPVLKRQAELETLVVRGRKRGLCVVLGFQAITQLRAIYGHDQTATLAAAPATKLILRTGEAETARWSSAQIGEREVTRREIGHSLNRQNGFTIHPHRQVESAVLASEIQMLPPFEGYLCIAGHHRARVRVPYLAPVRRERPFIRRVDEAALNPHEGSGSPIGPKPNESSRPGRRLRA
ncbi:MAG TPA: type IV secretion system DNA-binding domain-containing protein [Candidatus Binataceae bacterium]|nr:type IV secretion system DNA-binding domain-containing protein [Candidatus Binataceae bacterium]